MTKSSFVKPGTGFPLLSVTITSTLMTRTSIVSPNCASTGMAESSSITARAIRRRMSNTSRRSSLQPNRCETGRARHLVHHADRQTVRSIVHLDVKLKHDLLAPRQRRGGKSQLMSLALDHRDHAVMTHEGRKRREAAGEIVAVREERQTRGRNRDRDRNRRELAAHVSLAGVHLDL